MTPETPTLTSIETETGPTPSDSIIWLHGLGANGHDFAGVIPALGLNDDMAIRFIFPNAPERPVTINNGTVMPAWYDIYNDRFVDGEDADGINASANAIMILIQREIERGIDSKRIILAGFSQGGAIALHCGIHSKLPLAGLLILSSYLPLAAKLPPASDSAAPIFMLHGQFDTVVPLPLAQQSQHQLAAAGYPVQWQQYPIEHNVSIEELADIGRWISHMLSLE